PAPGRAASARQAACIRQPILGSERGRTRSLERVPIRLIHLPGACSDREMDQQPSAASEKPHSAGGLTLSQVRIPTLSRPSAGLLFGAVLIVRMFPSSR